MTMLLHVVRLLNNSLITGLLLRMRNGRGLVSVQIWTYPLTSILTGCVWVCRIIIIHYFFIFIGDVSMLLDYLSIQTFLCLSLSESLSACLFWLHFISFHVPLISDRCLSSGMWAPGASFSFSRSSFSYPRSVKKWESRIPAQQLQDGVVVSDYRRRTGTI